MVEGLESICENELGTEAKLKHYLGTSSYVLRICQWNGARPVQDGGWVVYLRWYLGRE
jgi:hypothetical protein